MNRIADYVALMRAAESAIGVAMQDGKDKHPPGTWKTETIEEQIKHIENHITAYQCGDRNEDHLTHIVCRAAIAYALQSRG